MSVPVWRRKINRAKFVHDIYQLNIRLGQIVANAPSQKYANSYGNALITTAQQALLYAQTGNDIWVSDEISFRTRWQQFQLCKGCINNIGSIAYIYLEIMRRHESIKKEKADKMYKWEDEIGLRCAKINDMLAGVMSADKAAWKKKMKNISQ